MTSPNQFSHSHQILIINGERVTALSDDANPVELPQITLVEENFGSDGIMYAMATSIKGGEVKVKLQPNSPQVKTWMRDFAQIQQGARINYTGSYGDSDLGYNTAFRGGFLKMAPPGISPGVTAEFTFVFEELVPEFDSARFRPSPG